MFPGDKSCKYLNLDSRTVTAELKFFCPRALPSCFSKIKFWVSAISLKPLYLESPSINKYKDRALSTKKLRETVSIDNFNFKSFFIYLLI